LLRITKTFWNHNGGTVCFGPDAFLYVAIGDGGSVNDPSGNGQNLGTIFGKVLRLDVDREDRGRRYAIPADNPFVARAGARPEVWAFGLRNPWRIAFDRETGHLWASDVGQRSYEEINILEAGGNYGWSVREGLHSFGAGGAVARDGLRDPIWEYSHAVGRSIIGGVVYRGKRLPELEGAYLYADYVSGRIWALRYDESSGRVVSNRLIECPAAPILSFGEDVRGDVYLLTPTLTGKGIYRLVEGRREAGRSSTR
jgi:glucose/arabinose dehydrogenase